EQIRQPQCQAFDDDDPARARRCAKRIAQANGFLNDGPLGRASCPGCGNARAHLLVIGGGGSDHGDRATMGACERFGIPALAWSHATQYERFHRPRVLLSQPRSRTFMASTVSGLTLVRV